MAIISLRICGGSELKIPLSPNASPDDCATSRREIACFDCGVMFGLCARPALS